MDPVQKLWMFEHWLADRNDNAELAKNHAYLLASFSHPDAVKQILGQNEHKSTDEEFEESTKMVKEINAKLEKSNSRKRHRKLITKS